MNAIHRLFLTFLFAFGGALLGAERGGPASGANRANNNQNSSQFGGQNNGQNGGQNISGQANAPVSVVNDPTYRLTVGDQIAVEVYEEPDLACSQLIDSKGIARLRDIGETKLIGLTVREAEHAIEEIYKQREILKRPVVSLIVTGFTPREVYVLGGGVGVPGRVPFAQDATSMTIVNAILLAGGFKPGAKQNAVAVRRKDSDGHDETVIVNVENMMAARKRGDKGPDTFMVFPGDIINVDVSIF